MKKIKIQSPIVLCAYANGIVTSWRLTYIGRDAKEGTYHYTMSDKTHSNIKIGVEIYSQTQELYDPTIPKNDGYVKIFCKDLNQPLKRGCTKFLTLEEFKEVKRVFNALHNAGRQLLQ
jgi:hypothetical protein